MIYISYVHNSDNYFSKKFLIVYLFIWRNAAVDEVYNVKQ